MSTDTASVGIILRWLSRLTDLTQHHAGQQITNDGLRDIAEMLVRDLPSAAFTSDSLHIVAQASEWFPRYPAIRRLVAEHWQASKPRQAPGPRAARGLSVMDELWVKFWHTRQAELAGTPDPGWDSPDPLIRRRSARGNLESLIRQQSPAAWAVISGRSEPPPGERTEGEAEAVRAAVAGLVASRQAMPGAAAPAPRLPRDVTAKGEHLDALRRATQRTDLPPAEPEPEPVDDAAPFASFAELVAGIEAAGIVPPEDPEPDPEART
jgi:hypothetical protein